MPTAVFRAPVFLEHDPGPDHPESRQRLEAVLHALDRDPIPGTKTLLSRLATRNAIERVHQAAYVDAVARTAAHRHVQLDPDTRTSAASWEAAQRAAGAAIEGVELAVAGASQGAFALVRPPGHHAEAFTAHGFCLFNNVAIAAAHALAEGGLRRVLVLDPDVHHGNGTQHAFWDREEVLYVSSHRFPFYPGTGAAEEIGAGPGRGYTVNLPLPEGTGDADFLYLYEGVVDAIVREFHPELILVSAGFDTWKDDPLGGMRMTGRGFAALWALFRRWADRYCPGRLVGVLEGGYDPAGLALGVRSAIQAIAAPVAPEAAVEGHVTDAAVHVARTVKQLLAPHWHGLTHVDVG